MRHARHGFRPGTVGLAVSFSIGLAACGGGGGGGAPSPVLQPDTGPSPYINPRRVTLSSTADGAPAPDTLVGVVDTGFEVDHFELRDVVAAHQDFGGSGSVRDNATPHGTEVAMAIAGRHVGHSGNARLLLAKAANAAGALGVGAVSTAGQWTLGQGARVLNFSLGPMHLHYGAATDRLFGAAVAADAVVVMVAGNGGQNLSTPLANTTDLFDATYATYRNLSLLVGASYGNQLAAYSNHPGENAAVQARFLVADAPVRVQRRDASGPAPDVSGLEVFDGTSAAAPVVSAAAATLRSHWPHLSAPQTAQLLLDTANRSFSDLYTRNDCGSSGQVNCGDYTFGRGKLDLLQALQPVGGTGLPAGVSLGAASYGVADTRLVLPAAFGDALQGQQLQAALFDTYGRDFRFNAARLLSVAGPAGWGAPGDHGAPARLAFGGGDWMARFSHGSGAQLAAAPGPLPLHTWAGAGPLGRYPQASRLALEWSGEGPHSFGVGSTVALSPGQGQRDSAWAQRHDVTWRQRLSPQVTLELGYALTLEHKALFGGTGSAGLGLSRSVAHSASARWRQQLGGGWSLFAQAELGRVAVQGAGLLTQLTGRTSEWGAGLAWDGPGRQWGLALSQPLRVDAAVARFDLPVGRTLQGQVLRDTPSLGLAPRGRQINLELAHQQVLDGRRSWGFNALLARDHGHVNGRNDWALAAHYQHRW